MQNIQLFEYQNSICNVGSCIYTLPIDFNEITLLVVGFYVYKIWLLVFRCMQYVITLDTWNIRDARMQGHYDFWICSNQLQPALIWVESNVKKNIKHHVLHFQDRRHVLKWTEVTVNLVLRGDKHNSTVTNLLRL